jgi:hypothetical protein
MYRKKLVFFYLKEIDLLYFRIEAVADQYYYKGSFLINGLCVYFRHSLPNVWSGVTIWFIIDEDFCLFSYKLHLDPMVFYIFLCSNQVFSSISKRDGFLPSSIKLGSNMVLSIFTNIIAIIYLHFETRCYIGYFKIFIHLINKLRQIAP